MPGPGSAGEREPKIPKAGKVRPSPHGRRMQPKGGKIPRPAPPDSNPFFHLLPLRNVTRTPRRGELM